MSEQKIFTGMSDASGAAALNDRCFIVANDEDNTLRIYDFEKPDAPQTVMLSSIFEAIEDGKKLEIDIEGAAQLGDLIFWIGSHSTNKDGEKRPARRRLFAIRVTGNEVGKFTVARAGDIYDALISDLENDSRFAVFDLERAKTTAPKAVGGLSIEGLTATPDGALLIGFRNPLKGGNVVADRLTGGIALIAKLLNPVEVIGGLPAKFDAPIALDLGGFGIRNIEYYKAENKYLIVAGPYHSNEPTAIHAVETGRLYFWSGNVGEPPEPAKNTDLTGLNIEAAFFFPQSEHTVALLSDDGSLENNSFRLRSFDLQQLS